MSHSFVAYIDEAGDEGFIFKPDNKGSTRWFVLSALVVRSENDHQVVQWVAQARERLHKPAKAPLHFRDLKHEHRVPLSRMIGEFSVRTVHVAIHKPSIEEPEIFQQRPSYALYRYASRLLIERISWLCRDNRKPANGNGLAKLVFSNRNSMSYDDLRTYISKLKDDPTARIDWSAIHPSLLVSAEHNKLAGLQLADAVATGMFYAVNANAYGETEERYLRLVAPTLYRYKQKIEGYGVKLWCNDQALLNRASLLVQSL